MRWLARPTTLLLLGVGVVAIVAVVIWLTTPYGGYLGISNDSWPDNTPRLGR